MAEQFLNGSVNWWNSRNLFNSSPCSSAAVATAAAFGWQNLDTKTVSDDSSDGSGSIVIQDGHVPVASTLPMPCFDFQSPVTAGDWNRNFLHDREGNYSPQVAPIQNSEMDQQSLYHQDSIINNFDQNFGIQQQISADGFIPNSGLGFQNQSLFQTLFDSESQIPQYLLHNSTAPVVFSTVKNGASRVQFGNSMPYWNANASFVPSVQPQFSQSSLSSGKPNFSNMNSTKIAAEKKVSKEPAAKRPRVGNSSPLPTFKVRKEKLGDRITALQQLVSPFGKTDTASVLQEATEYIKFLHEQVNALSAPYLKNGNPPLHHPQVVDHKLKGQKGLKDRGLCLVPISSTFPVASETTSDFWTPTFGANFR